MPDALQLAMTAGMKLDFRLEFTQWIYALAAIKMIVDAGRVSRRRNPTSAVLTVHVALLRNY